MEKYKKIDNLKDYVEDKIKNGAQIFEAEKTARILARQGMVGEHIVSWSVDAKGQPVMEKDAVVSADEHGVPGWVATKADAAGNAWIDDHGNKNQWIIDAGTFEKKYEKDLEHPGLFKPVGGVQKFITLDEAIQVVQWGKEFCVDMGGYINVTVENDYYVISGRDFKDTYRLVS